MKRLIAVLAIFALVFSFGMNDQHATAATPDQWLDQDAKVSEEVYDLLLERAGFASYIYTGTTVSMDPENVSTFIIEEKHDDFFIGKLNNSSNTNKILVTKDGLVVAYTPKEYAHTMFRNNRHFTEVQTTVKIFVGPTIQDANYINFASLNSNKATMTYNLNTHNIIVPSTSIINHIGYSYATNETFFPQYYGTILPRSLQPGHTHKLRQYGRYIDDILVFKKLAESMNIFYTSNSPIVIEGTNNYRTLDLTNNFVVGGQVEPPANELKSLKIIPSKTEMIVGESQTITLNGSYTDGTTKKINFSDANWSSTNPSVADVRNGKLVALTSGKTQLIAQYEGRSATVNIRVNDGNFHEFPHKLNVQANKKWAVKFNAPVDLKTVLNANIYVTDEQGNEVSVYHSPINGETIQVIPDNNYKAGETYTIWVKDIESSNGQILNQSTKMKFTIRK